MTDTENTRLDASPDRQEATKATAPKTKTSHSLLKNGLKLHLKKRNGYKSVLSRSNEDLSSQKSNGEPQMVEPTCEGNSSCSGSPTGDSWFNTWPERCDKLKSADCSPEHNVNTQNGNSTTHNKLTFNEALKNISLAYSPVTRKLHLVEDLNNCDLTSKESQLDNNKVRNSSLCDNKVSFKGFANQYIN